MFTYAGTFAGYTIVFINADFSFLFESSHFVSPANSLSKASYFIFLFCFNKGSAVNIQ